MNANTFTNARLAERHLKPKMKTLLSGLCIVVQSSNCGNAANAAKHTNRKTPAKALKTVVSIAKTENENQLKILESNLVVNVTGCKEESLRLIITGVIEGIKDAMHGVPVNLQINLYSADGNPQGQSQNNLTGEENTKWTN